MVYVLPPRIYSGLASSNLVFLAGPIKGAPRWHDDAIDIIGSYRQDVVIANPSRDLAQRHQCKALVQEHPTFARQRLWERFYLEQASKVGCIMFWLPGEVEHRCEKPYGSMTRVELGQWMTRYSFNPDLNIVIGSDGGFPELEIIGCDLSIDMSGIEIHSSLEETCLAAIKMF